MKMNFTPPSITSSEMLDKSSFESYAKDSIVEDDYQVPYKIPNCPAGSRFMNLSYYKDESLEHLVYLDISRLT